MKAIGMEYTLSGDVLTIGVVSDWTSEFPDGEREELETHLKKAVAFPHIATNVRVVQVGRREFYGHKKVAMDLTLNDICSRAAVKRLIAAGFTRTSSVW